MLTSIDFTRIGFLLGALCSGAVSFAAIRSLLLGVASRSWPTVAGRMLDAQVSGAPPVPWRATWVVGEYVRYTYAVNGQTYDGDTLGYASATMDENTLPYAAKLHMQRYRPGATVDVHYDPLRPERSVLEPGVTPSNAVLCAFMLAVTVFLAWLAAFG